jgi:hypothetical protein
LFNLKRNKKNKVHVEASIYKTYIFEEISIFISYYFDPHLKTKINRIPRHDDNKKVLLSEVLLVYRLCKVCCRRFCSDDRKNIVGGFVVMIERISQKEESCYVIGMIYSAQMHVIGDDIFKFIWWA